MNARVPGDVADADRPAERAAEGLTGRTLLTLLQLGQRAQTATTVPELGFTIVNETASLLGYRQAALFVAGPGGRRHLQAASGLASVGENSPFAVWLSRFEKHLPDDASRLVVDDVDPAWTEGWTEWLPAHLVLVTLRAPGETDAPSRNPARILGRVLYARDAPWSDADLTLLEAAHRSYAYCLWSLGRRDRGVRTRIAEAFGTRWLRWVLPLALIALLIPVRLSTLAPAEVVALHALAVAAPQDGVVARFHVAPNAPVKAGDLLFSLDDTTLKSRREVAIQGLATARADLLVAQQRAFDDQKSKGELAAAAGRVREKEAELALIETSLSRVDVRADRTGIAVYADANDWIGKPVQTGERVMQLADPDDAGVLVWLPAADALNLEPGAPIRLFLHTRPLDPLSAHLLQTSYQATPSPEGVASYRLRGVFEQGTPVARIGLRGTARVSGDWALLGYYLFRRPIAAVREWTGW